MCFSLGLIADPDQLRTKVQKSAISSYCLGSEHVVHNERHSYTRSQSGEQAANCSNTLQIGHLTRIPSSFPAISPLQSSPLSSTHAVCPYQTSPCVHIHLCNQKGWINFIFSFRLQRMSCLVAII